MLLVVKDENYIQYLKILRAFTKKVLNHCFKN